MPFTDADTMAEEVTQHIGGGFWLSLGWLGSQILQGGFKRAVSSSRTPVVSSFSHLPVALAWDPGACLPGRSLVKERASPLHRAALQAET